MLEGVQELKDGDLKSLLKQWIKLREQNSYYIRYGRDPGEEAEEEEDRLYRLIRKEALTEVPTPT